MIRPKHLIDTIDIKPKEDIYPATARVFNVDELTKRCTKCKVVKKLQQFPNYYGNKCGKASDCRVCRHNYHVQYYRINREHQLVNLKSKKLGIEPAEYLCLWEQQNKKCNLCESKITAGKGMLVKLNRFDKLVCYKCTNFIKKCAEKIDLIKKAMRYI